MNTRKQPSKGIQPAPRPSDEPEKWMREVYEELRAVARRYFRREKPSHTLQPTALVHEVYLRLADEGQVSWKGRTHFLAVSARAMRQILVDHARRKHAVRRGGHRLRMQIDSRISPTDLNDFDILALHDAIETLSRLDKRQAQVVELRFFSGMTVEEIAKFLGVSKRSVEGDWTHAKAWLRAELNENTR